MIHLKVSNFFKDLSINKFILIIIIFQIILHIPYMNLPPMGQHTWRQVMGLSTAKNYYTEKNSFLYPAQDVRVNLQDKGIIYFEFPLIYWIIGKSYHLNGFNHLNGRIMMLIMGILFLYGCIQLGKSLNLSEKRIKWFIFFTSCSPFFFYYSISVSPNLPALTWFIWGIALLIKYIDKPLWDLKYLLPIAFITIGTLSKATYLFFGLIIAYIFIRKYNIFLDIKIFIKILITACLILVPNLLFLNHANNIYIEAPFERQSYAVLKGSFFPNNLEDFLNTLGPAISTWFLEMFVNTAAIPIFIYSIFHVIKHKNFKNDTAYFLMFWLLSFFIFSLFFFTQFREHAYYLTPLIIFSSLMNAYGIEKILAIDRVKYLSYFLIILVPIVMIGRVYHRWDKAKQVPDELLYHSEQIKSYIPKNDMVLIFGDKSPVIYLYFLNRKGVVINNLNQNTIKKHKNN